MATINQTDLGATGRYIRFDQPELDDLGAQTHLAYVRPTNAGGGGFGYLYGKTPSASISGPRFYLGAAEGSGFAFAVASANGGYPSAVSSSGDVTFSAWQHLAATWDGTAAASGIVLYRDGADVTTTRQAGLAPVQPDAANNVFLMNRNGLGREYVGDFAYYAIWNRVLSGAELDSARTNGPLSVPSGLVLLYANGADLGPSSLAVSARSTYAAGALPPNTALGGAADTTAPTLTSASATATGATTASGSVTTDEANGTLYWLASANATELVATVKAGSSQAVTAIGAQPVTVTGLTASTPYYLHFVHTDAAANDSAVASSAQFTTDAETVVVKGATITLYNGATPQSSLTDLRVLWWDATAPDGTAPDYYSSTESTDAAGLLSIDIDAVTALSVGDYGYLHVHKAGTLGNQYRDAVVFSGAVQVQDIG